MPILILLCLFILSSPAFGQDRPTALKEGEALQGTFSQNRYLSGFERPIFSSGQFYFDPQRSLLWKTKVPFETELQINASGIIQSVGGKKTMNLPITHYPGLAKLHDVIVQVLRGQWQDLEAMFGSQIRPHPSGWQMSFKADEKAPFEEIEMRGSAYLEELVIKKSVTDFDEITFQQQMVIKVEK